MFIPTNSKSVSGSVSINFIEIFVEFIVDSPEIIRRNTEESHVPFSQFFPKVTVKGNTERKIDFPILYSEIS